MDDSTERGGIKVPKTMADSKRTQPTPFFKALEAKWETRGFGDEKKETVNELIQSLQLHNNRSKDQTKKEMAWPFVRDIWYDRGSREEIDALEDLFFEQNQDIALKCLRAFDFKTDAIQKELKNINLVLDILYQDPTKDSLSLDFVKWVNLCVCTEDDQADILFRTKMVGGVNSGVVYCLPSKIRSRLEDLLCFYQCKSVEISTLDSVHRKRSTLLLSVLFFSEFLHIRPFTDGNWETSCILLNVMMKGETIVPFQVQFDQVHGGFSHNEFPSLLAVQILEQIEQQCRDAFYLSL